jgi:hypothetical protein
MAVSASISGGVGVTVTLDPAEHEAVVRVLASLNVELSTGHLAGGASILEPASVLAGSGNATVLGGTQNDTFMGGHSFTSVVLAGDGSTVSGAQPNVFQFNSVPGGGSHLMTDLTGGRDQLRLVGYDTTGALSHAQPATTNVISLDSGKTNIMLTGVDNLHKDH